MSKKTILIIIIVLIALVAVFFGLSLVLKPTTVQKEEVAPREFTPFPDVEETVPESTAPTTFSLPSIEDFFPAAATLPTLTKPVSLSELTDFPVAGSGFVEREAPADPADALVERFDFTKYSNLKFGSNNESIKNLKVVLNRFLRKKGVETLTVDDNFGSTTKDAVILFQKEYKLTADGKIGNKTKLALNNFQKPEVKLISNLRFVSQADGHVYDSSDNIAEIKKITNTTIANLGESFLGFNDSVIFRFVKENNIETFLATLSENVGGLRDLNGSFLPPNIGAVALSHDKKNIFYTAPAPLNGGATGSVGFTMRIADSQKTQVFDSAFSEWLASWVGDNVYLQTKPSFSFGGYLYSLDLKTKVLNKILGNILGLTTLVSPDEKYVLLSNSTNNSFGAQLYNIEERSFVDLGLKTLPEKCVFNKFGSALYCAIPKQAPAEEYPDSWYQGIVSFSDNIWRINLETLSTTLVNEPVKEINKEVDAINLSIDSNEKNLVFTNKKDGHLFLLKI